MCRVCLWWCVSALDMRRQMHTDARPNCVTGVRVCMGACVCVCIMKTRTMQAEYHHRMTVARAVCARPRDGQVDAHRREAKTTLAPVMPWTHGESAASCLRHRLTPRVLSLSCRELQMGRVSHQFKKNPNESTSAGILTHK